jgi:hypothetical protein
MTVELALSSALDGVCAAASAIGCAAEAVFCAKLLCADSNSKQRQKKVRAKRVLIFFMELVPWQKSIILSDISAK